MAESGVQSTQDVAALRSIGADAVLIGETLMRALTELMARGIEGNLIG